MSCAQFFRTHQETWDSAINHQFLVDTKNGTLRKSQFDTWLVQDQHFAVEFTRLAARLLAKAPYSEFDVLLGGLEALRSELKWFKEQAVQRNLNLNEQPNQVNVSFCDYMQQASEQPYPVAAVIFWSIEVAYYKAWSKALPAAEPYRGFAERWGSDDFGAYCKLLEQRADKALEQASQAEKEAASAGCGQVAKFEYAFWQMAYEG